MTNYIQTLQKEIKGSVRFNNKTLEEFSIDESIFTLQPQVVVSPQDVDDIQVAMQVAKESDVSVIARGGGSSTTAAALGDAMILDFRTHMNKILHIENNHAWVQPGLFLGELNFEAQKIGKIFGPDPGSREYACVGGVVSTNAAGAHALAYGMTRDHVEEINCVMSDASVVSTRDMNQRFQKLILNIKSKKKIIEDTDVRVSKNSSGLFVEEFLKENPNFAKILTGSEAKLAIFESIQLQLVDVPSEKVFAIIPFESRRQAAKAVTSILDTNPACVELVDQVIQNAMLQAHPQICQELGLEQNKVSLWVEWFQPEAPLQHSFCTDVPEKIASVWKLRSLASKLLHAQARERKPLRCIEDACVPVSTLESYLVAVENLLTEHDCEGAIFGHIGNGHLHINPGIDVTKPNLEKRLQVLQRQFYEIVLEHKGSISGEHGDGYLRKPYVEKQWGQRMTLFQHVYDAFDPDQRLQPQKDPRLRSF